MPPLKSKTTETERLHSLNPVAPLKLASHGKAGRVRQRLHSLNPVAPLKHELKPGFAEEIAATPQPKPCGSIEAVVWGLVFQRLL